MYEYSDRSLTRLAGAHPDLIKVFMRAAEHLNITILESTRSVEQQRENVRNGVSRTMDSKHLHNPSDAIDAAPYPLRWPDRQGAHFLKDLCRWYYYGGVIMAVAHEMYLRGEIESEIRWGGDWDGDDLFIDQTFDDLPHIERRAT
jgi:hypothetical protein